MPIDQESLIRSLCVSVQILDGSTFLVSDDVGDAHGIETDGATGHASSSG